MVRSMVNENESKINILQLNFDVMESILKYLPLKDLYSYRLTCKTADETVRQIKLTHVDLRDYYNLHVEKFLTNEVKTLSGCVCLNLNHCYWLAPNTILQLLKLTKAKLKHLHLLECDLTMEIIKYILSLNLKSLSISWTRKWFIYLRQNVHMRIEGLEYLRDLEIFYPVSNYRVYMYVHLLCEYVLRRCYLLEKLKLYEYQCLQFCSHSTAEHRYVNAMKKPNATPLCRLKSIDIDFINCPILTKCIAHLLEAVLIENVSELTNVNLGMQSVPLLKEEIPIQKWQLLQKFSSTFCLGSTSSFHTKPLLRELFWGSNEHVQSMLAHLNYKNFTMRNLQFLDFQPIAQTLVENSKRSIETVNLAGCQFTQSLALGLHLIVRNCSQLIFLDLTCNSWKSTMFYNKFLLEAIGNLKHLERLHLTPFQIGCKNHVLSTNNPKNHLSFIRPAKIPLKFEFGKITSRCKNLNQIRIINHKIHNSCFVHEETLACIASCENLKELHLVNFNSYGKQSALPRISAGCTQLETVRIIKIANNIEEVNIRSLEEFLINAKSLKQLSLNHSVLVTKKFINALCNCKKMEKINLEVDEIKRSIGDYLGNNLHKLKRVWALRISYHRCMSTGKILLAELKRRQKLNPAFVYAVGSCRYKSMEELIKDYNSIPTRFSEHAPIAHFNLQQYAFVYF